MRTDELAVFVGAATTAYGLDPARIVALGFSNGANIAVSVLLRHPGSSRRGAPRPLLPYEPGSLPDLAGTDVFVAAGSHDPYSSPSRHGAPRDDARARRRRGDGTHRAGRRAWADPERSERRGGLAGRRDLTVVDKRRYGSDTMSVVFLT